MKLRDATTRLVLRSFKDEVMINERELNIVGIPKYQTTISERL